MLNAEEPLDGLYRGVIMDHYRRPRNRGDLAGMGKVAEGKNPLCGDCPLNGECNYYRKIAELPASR